MGVPVKLLNNTRVTSTTRGTGAYTLSAAPPVGFLHPAEALAQSGERFGWLVQSENRQVWELIEGVLTLPKLSQPWQLTRSRYIANSERIANQPVNWQTAHGTLTITAVLIADRVLTLDTEGWGRIKTLFVSDAPTDATHAVNKSYADAIAERAPAAFVTPNAGGWNGDLELSTNWTEIAAFDIADRAYSVVVGGYVIGSHTGANLQAFGAQAQFYHRARPSVVIRTLPIGRAYLHPQSASYATMALSNAIVLPDIEPGVGYLAYSVRLQVRKEQPDGPTKVIYAAMTTLSTWRSRF